MESRVRFLWVASKGKVIKSSEDVIGNENSIREAVCLWCLQLILPLCVCVCVLMCITVTDTHRMRPLLCVCNSRSQLLLINLLEDKPVLSPCLNSPCEVSPTDMWLANRTNRPSFPFHIQYSTSLTSTRLPELNFNFNHRPENLHKSSTWATLNYRTSILGCALPRPR